MRLRVEPQRVCGFLREGWLKPTQVAESSRLVENPAAGNGASLRPGSDPQSQLRSMTTLMNDLAETSPIEGARLFVELADALVHLDVAVGDFSDHTDRQLQAVAAACVSELLADDANDHELRWQLQSDEQHLMICAIPRQQLQTIADFAQAHGLKVASLQADFSLQWNRHGRSIGRGSAVFAVASQEDAVVACVDDGVISCLSSGQWLDGDASGTTRPQVERLMCSLGLDRNATASALDNRVDRLLASLGREPAAQSTYVLVAPDISAAALSPRWTVIDREAGAA